MRQTMKKKIFWIIFSVLVLGVLSAGFVVHYDDIFDKKEHEHNFEMVEDVAPTCTADGKKVYICTDCSEEKTETVAALGHSEEVIPGYAADCDDDGLTDGSKCTTCGETLKAQETIPALGHTEEVIPGYAADCDDDGLTDGSKCTTCGETLKAQETIPAPGHDFIDGACIHCGMATVDSLWAIPASDGYTVDGNKMTFAGTSELVFSTKEKYNSVSLTFKVSETQDVRGAFQIGWGAQTTDASINTIPFVQFNYDRAVLVLPDGTKYDTSWVTGETWRLTIDEENSNVVLSVDGQVVYNVDASWWTQEGWGLPGYLILRAESNCALTFELTEMMPQ